MNFKKLLFTVCACISVSAYADDPTDLYVDTAHFDDGDKIPYVFTPSRTMPPKYVLIMMPGGSGVMGISKNEDGTPFFNSKGNFLIASRAILSDSDIATISIDRGRSLNRMRAVVADIKSKYPNAKIYIAGTSRSTTETIYQSENMDGEVAGFIHTSSVSSIGGLDSGFLFFLRRPFREFRFREQRSLITIDEFRERRARGTVQAFFRFRALVFWLNPR